MSETALWLLVLLPAVVGGGLALSRLERAAAAVSLATATATPTRETGLDGPRKALRPWPTQSQVPMSLF